LRPRRLLANLRPDSRRHGKLFYMRLAYASMPDYSDLGA
jgi:hypothetical protein